MSEHPQWLPDLIRLSDYGGRWEDYVEAIYAVFRQHFVGSQPCFEGRPVHCQCDPVHDGKEVAFWHCIQEGQEEEGRTPNLRRCERVAWPRAIIEHADDPLVQRWSLRKSRDWRTYLWYHEEYLVALAHRRKKWQLITAFPTDRRHTRARLRNEIRRAINS